MLLRALQNDIKLQDKIDLYKTNKWNKIQKNYLNIKTD